jgi:hypothetical protein
VADDRGSDGDGLIGVDQTDALFDMEFDEGTDSGQPRLVTPDPIRIEAIATGDVGEGVTGGVLETECPVGVDGAGEQSRAEAGDAEARALLLGEHCQGEGPGGLVECARGLEHVEGRQRRGDTEWTVEFASAGDGVEVGSGDDGVRHRAGWPMPT